MQKLGINEVWQLSWWKEPSDLVEYTEVYLKKKKPALLVKKQTKLLLIDFNLGWNTSCLSNKARNGNNYKWVQDVIR